MVVDILSLDPVLGFLGLVSLFKYAALHWIRRARPAGLVPVGRVKELYLYPLKSAAAVSVDRLDCSFDRGAHHGLIADRCFSVTSDELDTLDHPLRTLHPSLEDSCLVIRHHGNPPLTLDISEIEKTGKTVTYGVAKTMGSTIRCLDCGDVPAKWISDVIQLAGCRLLYAPPSFDTRRCVPSGNMLYGDWVKTAKDIDKLRFEFVSPFHLTTSESLLDLNSRLDCPIEQQRFRPNIVLENVGAPYAEDRFKQLYIGDAVLTTIKLTNRCIRTTVSSETNKFGKEPLKTLSSYRKIVPDLSSPIFGLNLVLERPGHIRVGDPVYGILGDNTCLP